jgi:hypothetical protein
LGFERGKTFHALDRAASVIGVYMNGKSLHQYVSEFKDVYISDGKVLFCQTIGKSVVAQHDSQVRLHLSRSKHIVVGFGLKDRPVQRVLLQDLPNLQILRQTHAKHLWPQKYRLK